MDASAINAIRDLADEAAQSNRLGTTVPAVLVSGEPVSLEHLTGKRAYFRGLYRTTSLAAFSEYVKTHGGHGFINAKNLCADVIHNLGDSDAPGASDWLSTLSLTPTAAYSALSDIEGNPITQKGLAEWLEDWSPYLRTLMANDAVPESITKGVHAIRSINIKASRDTTHTDKDYGASRSSLEDIEASAKGGMPYGFRFRIEPFADFQTRDITLRLSVITGEDPRLKLRIVGRERLRESIAEEFRDLLVESIGDAATMTIGTFTP